MVLRPILPASHRRCSRLVLTLIFIYFSFHDRFMARGKNDLILRDRLQFTLNAQGDLDVVYGRVDLSDYVSVVNNQGLSIKEMRVHIRNPNGTDDTGVFNPNLIAGLTPEGTVDVASMKIFGTTTAYESAVDVGIGSPNTFFNAEIVSFASRPTGFDTPVAFSNTYTEFGTPDLHPEGYVVVSDVLVGIASRQSVAYADTTLEVDIMLIAEPIKVTKDELKEMLAQATDL